MRRPSAARRAVRYALVALALLWSGFPILLVVLSSFKQANQIFEVPTSFFFRPTFENYEMLWNSRGHEVEHKMDEFRDIPGPRGGK